MVLALKDINSDVFEPIRYTNTLTSETKRAYLQNIKEFFSVNDLNDITIQMVRKITFEHINYFILHLQEKGRSNATINRKISAISSFFDYCIAIPMYIINENPAKNKLVHRLKVNNKSTTNWMPMKQIRNTIIEIDNFRDKIICKLFASTGLRNSELRNIKMSNIKMVDGNWLLEVLGKGDKLRYVKIKSELKQMIDEYVENYRPKTDSPYLFIGESRNRLNNEKMSRDAIGDVINKYFPKGFTPHSMRHSCATEMIKQNAKLTLVQEMLGHEDINTTMRYNHNADYMENYPGDCIDV